MRPTTGRPTTSSVAIRPKTGSLGWKDGTQTSTDYRPPSQGIGATRTFMPSSRMGTSNGRRPTTAALGMAAPMTARAGRGIQDKMFWHAELKQKIALIEKEIEIMYNQAEEAERNTANLVSFTAKQEKMREEIDRLQGSLADLNSSVHAINTDVDLKSIKSEAISFSLKRNGLRSDWEQAVEARKGKELQLKNENKVLADEEARLYTKLQVLSTEEREEYNACTAERKILKEGLENSFRELENIKKKSSKLQNDIGKNALQSRTSAQLHLLVSLQNAHESLKSELAILRDDSGPIAKDRLLEKLKVDNQDISGMERASHDLQETVSKLNMALVDIENQLGQTYQDKALKFDELKSRFNEMGVFIDRYAGEKLEVSGRTNNANRKIMEAMERIPLSMARPVDDLTQLRNEQEKRKDDISRIKSLESKLDGELAILSKQEQRLSKISASVSDIGALRNKAISQKEENLSNIDGTRRRKHEIDQLVTELQSKFNRLASQYRSDETAQNLLNQMAALQKIEAMNFVIKENTLQRVTESGYSRIKENVLARIEELNLQTQNILQHIPVTKT